MLSYQKQTNTSIAQASNEPQSAWVRSLCRSGACFLVRFGLPFVLVSLGQCGCGRLGRITSDLTKTHQRQVQRRSLAPARTRTLHERGSVPQPTLSMLIVFPSGLLVLIRVVGVSVPVSRSLFRIEMRSSQESRPTAHTFVRDFRQRWNRRSELHADCFTPSKHVKYMVLFRSCRDRPGGPGRSKAEGTHRAGGSLRTCIRTSK